MKLAIPLAVSILLAGCSSVNDTPPAATPTFDPQDDGNLAPSAMIAPGGRLRVEGPSGGQSCTLNFLFTDANGSTYGGTAGHCFDGVKPNSTVALAGVENAGIVIYSSWWSITDSNERTKDDFALVLIDTSLIAVDPSFPGVGGPVGLAPSASATAGTGVYAFGNSTLRPTDDLSLVAGTIASHGDPRRIYAYMRGPVIPGDSGGPVLDEHGRALGVLGAIQGGPNLSGRTPVEMAAAGSIRFCAIDLLLIEAEQRGAPRMELLPGPDFHPPPLLGA